jgi:hypothetical protein
VGKNGRTVPGNLQNDVTASALFCLSAAGDPLDWS